jgi:hypothetical protein
MVRLPGNRILITKLGSELCKEQDGQVESISVFNRASQGWTQSSIPRSLDLQMLPQYFQHQSLNHLVYSRFHRFNRAISYLAIKRTERQSNAYTLKRQKPRVFGKSDRKHNRRLALCKAQHLVICPVDRPLYRTAESACLVSYRK